MQAAIASAVQRFAATPTRNIDGTITLTVRTWTKPQAKTGGRYRVAGMLLEATEVVWICGSRRSFPVAAYLDYALQHTDKRIMLVSGLGSMHEGQTRSVRSGDVIIAIISRGTTTEAKSADQVNALLGKPE